MGFKPGMVRHLGVSLVQHVISLCLLVTLFLWTLFTDPGVTSCSEGSSQLHFLWQLFDILLFLTFCVLTHSYIWMMNISFFIFLLDSNWGNGIFPEADFEIEMLNSRCVNKSCNSPTFVLLLIIKFIRKIYVKQLPYYKHRDFMLFHFRYFLVSILFFLFF